MSNRICKIELAPVLNPLEGISENRITDTRMKNSTVLALPFSFYFSPPVFYVGSLEPVLYWSRCVEIHDALLKTRGEFSVVAILNIWVPWKKFKKMFYGSVSACSSTLTSQINSYILFGLEVVLPLKLQKCLIAAFKGVIALDSKVPGKC